MRKILSRKFQNCWRRVFLLAVFAGLLFSGGEGIRLFPFSGAGNFQHSTVELKNFEGCSYEKNLHRFQSDRANSETKFQRNNPQNPHWLDVFYAFDNHRIRFKVSARQHIDNSLVPQFFKSCLISAPVGSRAPPAFS